MAKEDGMAVTLASELSRMVVIAGRRKEDRRWGREARKERKKGTKERAG